MNKMQMAHEYALEMLKETIPTGSLYGSEARSVAESIVKSAFALADMMQAEADKREDKTRPEVLEEWQPDWSQAPDGYNWWAADQRGCYWYDRDPKWIDGEWGGYTINKKNRSVAKQTSSLGYIGNWKNSLRKRPESIKHIDPKEYIDAVLQDIVDPCDHEWTHISKFGAEGDFYVCPCGAKSKRPQRRTK